MSNSNEYMREYMRDRYRKRRLLAIEKLGGRCEECKSDDDLHFHHRDPETKLFTIAKGSSFSQARWDAEVAKCYLLCSDCHVGHHGVTNPHGSINRYWQGRRCGPCSDTNKAVCVEYRNKQKLASLA
jgi:hypothetical protein